jgi:hypothetical protein
MGYKLTKRGMNMITQRMKEKRGEGEEKGKGNRK